jgi:DNA anti-recombination protein RmuC
MIETLLIVIGIGLIVLVAIAAISLARVTALMRSRDAGAGLEADIRGRLDGLGGRLADHERDVRTDLAIARNEQAATAGALRQELAELIARQQQGMARELGTMSSLQHGQLRAFGERLGQLTTSSEVRLDALRRTVEQRLDVLREENTRKLDEMRATVDDKLQATLEQRLGAVKTEFGRFGELLAKTKDRLDQVGKTLDEAGRKSTTIARKLRDVEALPEDEADRLLASEGTRLLDLDEEAAAPALVPPPAH